MKLINPSLVFVFSVQMFFVTAEAFGNSNQGFKIPIHYNLTELIDTVLYSNDSGDHKALKDALENSRFVFYETDVALNNFSSLIPLIDLMQLLKPEGVPPQIILSLKYVNRTSWTFPENRANDLFYNSEPQLKYQDRAKFVKFIGAVTLDFYTPNPQYQSFFHGKSYLETYFDNHSFTYSVKSFLMHMLGLDVPVGIIHGKDFYSKFIKNQAQYADFYVYCIERKFHSQFPMFAENFYASIDNELRNRRNQVQNYFGSAKLNDLVTLQLFNDHNPINLLAGEYNYQSSDNYWTTFGRVIGATSNYTAISKQLLQRAYTTAQETLNEVVQKWGSVKTENLVISTANWSVKSERKSADQKKKLIHPFLQLQEDEMSVCNLRANLSAVQKRFVDLSTDEKTWRCMTRYSKAVMDDANYCYDNDATKIDQDLRQNVTLNFTTGISNIWENIEPSVVDLVYNHSNVGPLRLETLLFSEDDIKASVAIQNFATQAKQSRFRLGCSVSFFNLRTLFSEFYYGKVLTYESFKTTLEAKLCQPLFDSIDVFVWRVDDLSYGYFPRQGLLSSYSDMFLGREIFLSEFPDRKVLVEFTSHGDRQIMADVFDAHIAMPMNQIEV